jgi:hypothetical protein
MLHQEGEVWTEKGKTWTIKNGIKRTVSKFTQVRKELQTPLCCPKCSKTMKAGDEQIYKFNKVCLECTVKFEGELRRIGKYEEYEKARIQANAKGFVMDLDTYFSEYFQDSTNNSFDTEDGDVEAWIGNSVKRVEEIIKPELDKLKTDFNV